MKKVTTLIIILVYLASIVIIGFFGMRVKVYDEIKYIKSIEMSVEAENPNMFSFEYIGLNGNKNKTYILDVNFDHALEGIFNGEAKLYLPLSLIPYVTYDTGDVGNSEEEKIKYTFSNQTYANRGYFTLSNKGELIIYKKSIAFDIYINPISQGRLGSGAVIKVFS